MMLLVLSTRISAQALLLDAKTGCGWAFLSVVGNVTHGKSSDHVACAAAGLELLGISIPATHGGYTATGVPQVSHFVNANQSSMAIDFFARFG